MWKTQTFDCSDVGISEHFTYGNIRQVRLPRLTIRGELLQPTGAQRCYFHTTQRKGEGGNGFLEELVRIDDTTNKLVLLKKPRDADGSLRIEAFIQWFVRDTFERNGLHNRVPVVCDIMELPDKTEGFTMDEFTHASLCSTYLTGTLTLRKDIFHLLIQVAILLQTLEHVIGFDHRDLKADNLLIMKEESQIRCYCPDLSKHLLFISPFTVCIIDFGFACLGDQEQHSITVLSADDTDTLPPLDPCPKDGRDIYHLIVSLYSIEKIRNRLEKEPELHAMFKDWLNIQNITTNEFAERWAHSEWVYLITSHKNFKHNKCTSQGILTTLYSIEPSLFKET